MTWSSEILADSPSGWWRQDDTSGTTMTDALGSHNGTMTGSYTLNQSSLVPNDANKSVDYSGGKGTVAGGSWMNASQFSVKAVINADTIPGGAGYAFIVSRDLNGTAGPWWMAIKGGKVSFLLVAGSITEFIGTATLSTGTPTVIDCVYDGGHQYIYINGVLDNSQVRSGTPTANTQDLVIGNWPAANLPFDGRIDEVVLFPSALSSGRVAAHYAAGFASPIVVSGSAFAAPATFLDGAMPISLPGEAFASPATMSSGSALTAIRVDGDPFASAAVMLDGFVQGTPIIGEAWHSPAVMLSGGVIKPVGTDTSNAFSGRQRGGSATVELTVPVTPTPATSTRGPRVDKAVPLPLPTLVNGRPT